ncbi:hypothetical protein PsorP6_006170 [Peronosclerospora sorghi]|uniref:Uncharacterized protein n=1 Tax=Peronosclerospora sorghi TaxID=230839 RepID=A0ACC0W4E1_9STRA|nr:hypothetical protein PsorP6_006170 [Peronosclerospora sorghi]
MIGATFTYSGVYVEKTEKNQGCNHMTSCRSKYRKVVNDSLEYKIDYWAQINVAEILAQAAGDIKPTCILSQGDNIYWKGPVPKDIEYRMETTF